MVQERDCQVRSQYRMLSKGLIPKILFQRLLYSLCTELEVGRDARHCSGLVNMMVVEVAVAAWL